MDMTIWCEKYRPKTLEELILPEESRITLEKYKETKDVPHLLFVGTPGTGKTSAAKVIVNDILKCDYLYINASDENGIDTIRTKVVNFAQTMAFNEGLKIIILDEGDALSGSSQRALRNIMEEYAAITRFIITGNYKHKIIDALQSRCQTLNFNNSINDVAKHCISILKKENIQIPGDQKDALLELIKSNYPDLRKILNDLQKHSISGTLNINLWETSSAFIADLHNVLLHKNITEVRKFVISNERSFQNDYHALMKSYLEYLYEYPMNDNQRRDAMLIIADYMYKHSFVIDTEINCFACMINVQKALK